MDVLKGMSYHLDPASTLPKYRQISRALSAFLQASQMPAGTKLPNDRELAKRFNTAVMTMAKALNYLAAKGMIERKVGSGTFVCNSQKTSPINRRVAIVCHSPITMEGGFVTSLLSELYKQAPEYCFDLMQLRRTPDEYEKTIAEYGLAGVIVLSAEIQFMPKIAQLSDAGMNIVQLGFWHKNFQEISIGSDHEDGAKKAVEYLYSLGHRKIGVISSTFENGTIHHSNISRIEGYKKKMQELDLTVLPEWIIADHCLANNTRKYLQNLVDSGNMPTAFLLLNLPMTPRIYHILQSMGMNIPGDISLVGFDESYLCEQLTPGFTTLSQNMQELAKSAMQKLDSGKKSSIPSISLQLTERASCKKIN